jgi:WD40 repeat protein
MNTLYDISQYRKDLLKYLIPDVTDIILKYLPIFYNKIKNIFSKTLCTSSIKILDDNHIVSCSSYYIEVWNIREQKPVTTFYEPGYIQEIEVLGNNIAITKGDHSIKIINYLTEREFILTPKNYLYYFRYYITHIKKFNNTSILVGSSSGHILLLDIFNKLEKKYIGHNSPITHIEKINDSTIISSSKNNEIIVWNIYTRKCLRHYYSKNDIISIKRINDEYFILVKKKSCEIFCSKKLEVFQKFRTDIFNIKEVLVYDDDIIVIIGKYETSSYIILWNYKTNNIKEIYFYYCNIESGVVLKNKNIICGVDNIRFISIK